MFLSVNRIQAILAVLLSAAIPGAALAQLSGFGGPQDFGNPSDGFPLTPESWDGAGGAGSWQRPVPTRTVPARQPDLRPTVRLGPASTSSGEALRRLLEGQGLRQSSANPRHPDLTTNLVRRADELDRTFPGSPRGAAVIARDPALADFVTDAYRNFAETPGHTGLSGISPRRILELAPTIEDAALLKATVEDVLPRVALYGQYNRRGLAQVEVIAPEEWTRINTTEHWREVARRYGVGEGDLDRVIGFPVRVGDDPVWGIGPPGIDPRDPGFINNALKSVGSDPMDGPGYDDISPEALAALVEGGEIEAESRPAIGSSVAIDQSVHTALAQTESGQGLRRCNEAGGTPCFHTAVALHRDGGPYCSGVLIHPEWVLTAAHCFCGAGPTVASIGKAIPTRADPLLYETAIQDFKGQPIFFPSRLARPGPSPFCEAYRNWRRYRTVFAEREAFSIGDLALIRLVGPLQYTVRLPDGKLVRLKPKTARLGHPKALPELFELLVAGYGRNDWQAQGGDKTFVPLAHSPKACGGEGFAGCLTGQETVLLDPNRVKDSCSADSGAGAYARRDANGDFTTVYAIVSRGSHPCGKGGSYALVARDPVLNWISDVVGDVDREDPVFARN